MNKDKLLFGLGLAVVAFVLIICIRKSTSKSNYHPLSFNVESSTPQRQGYRRQHPVLEYQRKASLDTHPASYGDPIRPLGIPAGPSGSGFYGAYDNAYSGFQNNFAYDPRHQGPFPGKQLNVPVPQASLKMASEEYGYPFHYQQNPLAPYDYFKPYGPNQAGMQGGLEYADTPFYKRGGQPLQPGGQIPFISSVNSYAPFPEVSTPWEKTGMMQTVDPSDNTILNLYRRPIAPLQDLFEYAVQDKDGFILPLQNTNFLEDGDIVDSVPGKESKGRWKANIYVNNKWVWS